MLPLLPLKRTVVVSSASVGEETISELRLLVIIIIYMCYLNPLKLLK